MRHAPRTTRQRTMVARAWTFAAFPNIGRKYLQCSHRSASAVVHRRISSLRTPDLWLSRHHRSTTLSELQSGVKASSSLPSRAMRYELSIIFLSRCYRISKKITALTFGDKFSKYAHVSEVIPEPLGPLVSTDLRFYGPQRTTSQSFSTIDPRCHSVARTVYLFTSQIPNYTAW